jgi:hypothetical protein
MLKKSIMLPVLAVIAGAAASAFTTVHTHLKNDDQPSLYWYTINADQTLGALQNTTPETKADAMPGGSNPLTSCTDQVSPDCLRGYSTTQTIGEIAPPPQGDDYRIQESD